MHKKAPDLYISIALILTSLVSSAFDGMAQSIKRQTISSYGSSSVVTENVTISQTAGQAYNTIANHSNGSITQGFQQPPAFTVEEIINSAIGSLDVMVYPNPASHTITLSSKELMALSFIQVTDVNGRIFKTEKVTNMKEHKINCASWANGIYLITIQDQAKNHKSLRLIISK